MLIRCRYTRRQSELFLTLPDPVDYRDYYLLIKNPIAMDMIAHRINSTYYKSIDDFVADFRLMFENAFIYNEDGSQVCNDANALKAAFESKFQTLCPDGQLIVSDQDSHLARKRGRESDSEGPNTFKIRLNVGKKMKLEEDEDDE